MEYRIERIFMRWLLSVLMNIWYDWYCLLNEWWVYNRIRVVEKSESRDWMNTMKYMWKYILISCLFTYSLLLHFIFICFINKHILYHFLFILYHFHFICFTSKMNIHQKITQIHSRPLPINSTNDSKQYWFLDNFVKIAMYITTSLLFLSFFYYWLMGI